MFGKLFTTLILSLAVCHGLVAKDAKPDSEGFVSIFDGKTLTGWEEKRMHKGMIQLQLHDPGMVVHFKNLRLKILK